jgi:stress response protein YsnF
LAYLEEVTSMTDRSPPVSDAVTTAREVIPIVEERATILKRKSLTEGVRVRTVVREDEATVEELVKTEEVEFERVPLDRWVDAPVPVRQEGDTTIITLIEEVVVVEKRLRATEEVRITKRQDIEPSTHTVTLRREEAVVERLSAGGSTTDDRE